jgi:ribulose-bisphosphate carboxylase large chain
MNYFPSLDVHLSGERFFVTYFLAGAQAEARIDAEEICLEQTVELSTDPYPAEVRFSGQIEDFRLGDGGYLARISYPLELTDFNLPQLLNVVFGNTSMKAGVRVVDLELSQPLLNAFPGPKFGAPGLRRRLDRPKGALLGTALKPVGFPAEKIAEYAYQFALGGIDVIKDDHNLANQPFAPFRERVERCAEAVERANRQTGRRAIYVPNVTAPQGEITRRANLAQAAGAGGLEVAAGLCGWESLRGLAADPAIQLPIFCHPALLGTYWVSPSSGISLGVVLGQIARLAGADAAILTNYGGRFSTTARDVRDLIDKCSRPLGHFPGILPMPGGGMTLERVGEILEFYGDEVILLISGGLYGLGEDLVENCRRFRSSLGAE